MLIRSASLIDLNACLALDANSQTDHVWQMDAREEGESKTIHFHTVRLPRVMRVAYPRQRDDLLTCWEGGSLVLVATDRRAETVVPAREAREGEDVAGVYAYCQLDVVPWQRVLWIEHLIVDRPYRRRGIGTAIVAAAKAWGAQQGLTRLMIAVQTKNYPGIAFCEKQGFAYCGYNDCYYENRDIALFFSLRM
ncbi:MAG: GNAT family N-acetyltransferase [Anaerolineae bacterium]|nr:GNAT family N-acetyltransferase [Anaerolineae bacterium]